MESIIAIDAGTTSSRTIAFNKKIEQIAISQFEFTQIFPKKSWVEHDPNEIWETQLKAIKEVLKSDKIDLEKIKSIGITNQRETTVIWNRESGKPIYNAIVWQDRRTAQICESLSNQTATFLEKTGLVLDAYFSGTKVKWILDNVEDARELADQGKLAFGTIDTWLIWKLTKGKVHVTDVTNASRTLLFNINTLQWDDELLSILNIPKELLPKVVSSSEIIGHTDLTLFGKKIPISGIAGDQQSALFGQMCINEGDVKNTYGTGCFCIMNTGKKIIKSKNRMLSTVAWKLNNEVTYALEGSVFIAGALVQWLRDKLSIIENASEIENLAKQVDDNGGVTFVPALSGLGAPYWNPNATGTIFGLTRDSNKSHIARAALEAIALRSREIILEMQKDAGFKFKELKVDGGASKNNLLMQLQADLLNKNVVRSKSPESTALGAAFFAGLSVGFWSSIEEIRGLWEKDVTFFPDSSSIKTQKIIDQWNKRIRMINE